MSLSSEEQLIALREGNIDAGFLYTRPEQSEEFDHLRLASHRFMAVMLNDHRLAGTAALKLADLRGEDFVFFTRSSGSIVYDRIMAGCRAGGLEPRVVQETVGEHMQLGLVAAGMGISFVNETVATRQLRPELVIKPVTDLTVEEHLDLTWRRGDVSGALGSLIELARRV